METRLAPWIKGTPAGDTADAALRACVHCGFCNATCPTYQLLGDELDGPRGRIYQIKQVLEDAPATRSTQLHLDRCLTCRSCETTCPSGVSFGQLLDIGRAAVDERVTRPCNERLARWLLREGLTRRWLFGGALRLGRALSFAMPEGLRQKVGARRPAGRWPKSSHPRKVLLLNGCTQPSIYPSIDAATARVLDAIGVQAVVVSRSGCCGAIRHHLSDQAGALRDIRRNIDAWWLQVSRGSVEAIVINASGCGAMLREYAHLLRDEPQYAEKARRIAELTCDLSDFLSAALPQLTSRGALTSPAHRLAVHSPCTLQHALRARGPEELLTALGAELTPVADAHLCCGSAGTYSLLQSELSRSLRDRKLSNLSRHEPRMILSANIGCIAHLQTGTRIPVRHWIEWVDARISGCGETP
jgi:glycolate oxidase iron-sulfur subunit